MPQYDFRAVEAKWQKTWKDRGAFQASDTSSGPKYYVLVEFPYPSGEGLHIGHPRSYVAMDVIARKRRMEGYNVLYPMGWDAFGLPTENYAIKTKQHPRDITRRNIANFKRVMDRLGLSFDWSREVNTSDPAFYRWTQWTFLKMWEKGLAYKAQVAVNWCDSCKVGLANEEVVDGGCERCGTVVVLRKKEQWMLRITAYAERLLRDLDNVDYLPGIKAQQINWIGRSDGAEITFPIVGDSGQPIRVFTTRPDTIFGATFLVLSPDADVLRHLLPLCFNQEEIRGYLAGSEIRESPGNPSGAATGVELKGIEVLNPASRRKIPVWVSDYVLSSYGTGAIMAVPAHDERDWKFANRYSLPVLQVIESLSEDKLPLTGIDSGVMTNSGRLDGLSPHQAISRMNTIMQEDGFGQPRAQYRLRDWVFSRQRFWGEPIPMVNCPACGWVPVPETDLPVVLPEVLRYEATTTGESPLALFEDWVNTHCPKCGSPAKRETDTMPQWAGSSWYFLRYCDPHNDKCLASTDKLKYWTPVDWYNGGMEHTTLHLLYSRFWHKFLFDIGAVPTAEPFARRTSHGMVLGENGEKMSKSRGNVISPDDVLEKVGADSLRLFELFMGEFDQAIPWSTHGLAGMSRFLQRVWELSGKVTDEPSSKQMNVMLNRTVKQVSERIELMKFNTALASLMELTNAFAVEPAINRQQWSSFLRLLAPFAPHIAEELWHQTGKSTLMCREPWPVYDHSAEDNATIVVPIQVDGKLRNRVVLSPETSDEELRARALEAVSAKIAARGIRRIVVVRKSSGVIVNVVTELSAYRVDPRDADSSGLTGRRF